MNPSQEKAIVEISHDVEEADFARKIAIGASGRLSAIPASLAFRKYQFINGIAVPTANRVGNFRGMVICKRAKVAYNVIIKSRSVLEGSERYFLFASVALNVAEQYEGMEKIVRSNDSLGAKAGKLVAHADSLLMRSMLGIFKPATGALAWTIEQSCDMAASQRLMKTSCSSTVARYQKAAETTFDQMTDPNHVYSVVTMTLRRLEDNVVDSLSRLY